MNSQQFSWTRLRNDISASINKRLALAVVSENTVSRYDVNKTRNQRLGALTLNKLTLKSVHLVGLAR